MLTAQALERATPGYRMGYRDGRDGRPHDPTNGGRTAGGVWHRADYTDGYEAGVNDAYWAREDRMVANYVSEGLGEF